MLETHDPDIITTLVALTHSTAGWRMAGPTWLIYPAVGCGAALWRRPGHLHAWQMG
jgi:hypothetical protein